MIKELQMVEGRQDVYCRRIILIEPKPDLRNELSRLGKLEADDSYYELEPTVIMTDPVPFEQDLEGWRASIRRKAKEGYLRSLLAMQEDSPIGISIDADVFSSMEQIESFFDRYWSSREIHEYVELETGCWKTERPHQA